MRLLVFGRFSPTADQTLQAVVDVAVAAGHVVVCADIHAFVTGPVRWSPHSGVLTLGDVTIGPDDVDVVLLGPLPSAFARTSPPGTVIGSDAHDRRVKQQAARHALSWSVVVDLEARGIPVLSSPTLARPFDHKPLQLAALSRAGIAVPTTVVFDGDILIGDDDDGVITKPVLGGAVDFDGVIAAVAGRPRLIQQRLRGRQWRVAVVGGEVVAAGAVDVDGDWRTMPGLRWSAAAVDEPLRSLVTRAAAVCHFDVCAVDVIEAADGPVVVEVNRTPQLQDLAADLDVDLAAAIVALCDARARR